MSLHALVEKWRKEAAAYDAAYQRTASGWQPDWQSYGSALARERCADELESALRANAFVSWATGYRNAPRKDCDTQRHEIDAAIDAVLQTSAAPPVATGESVVFQGTTAQLQSAYFGDWSAARAWAGKNGSVTMHTVRRLEIVTNPGGSRE